MVIPVGVCVEEVTIKTMSVPNSWSNQFGAEYAVPPEVVTLLKDVSWGNDMCPSFVWPERLTADYAARGWVLWVDHPEATKREHEGKRFLVVYEDQDLGVQWEALATDDCQQALRFMESLRFDRPKLCGSCGMPNGKGCDCVKK